jgi:hypothetical protein
MKKIAYLHTYAEWYTQEDCGFELGNQTKNMGISGLRNYEKFTWPPLKMTSVPMDPHLFELRDPDPDPGG